MSAELTAISRFRGMLPIQDDGLLSEENGVTASYAENVELNGGNILPVRRDAAYGGMVIDPDSGVSANDPMVFAVPISTAGDLVFVTRQYDHCAALTDISGDTRIYLSGEGVASKLIRRKAAGSAIIMTSSNPYGSAIPAVPVITVTRADPTAAPTRYAVVAATYVYADGSEGPLSPYTAEFSYIPEDAYSFAPVALGAVTPAPVGVNFYITVPSASTDAPTVKLLVETTSPQFPTEGVLPNDVLGESYEDFAALPLALRTVAPAPWGGLAFTTEAEPGIVQFTDTMYLNRVYRTNDLNVGARVTCLIRGANVLFVLCDDGGPFVISGTELGSHILTQSHTVEILASGPRGAATIGDTCVYAGSRGLVSVNSAATVTPVTEGVYFDWRQWAEMGPRECALICQSDNSLVFSMPSVAKTGILKPYGLVWRTGRRRVSFSKLPSDNSLVFI